MTIEQVENGSKEARRAAIAALTLAFAQDPVMRWMYPSPDAYLTHFPGFADAFGGPAFAHETAWTTTDAAGASLWLPSGVHPDGDAIEAAAFGTIDASKHEDLTGVLEQMDDFHPEEPHWYLAIIGVDAAQQGRGLGAALMEPALERCDEEGLIAYLESSNPANISLYQRHGFEVIGEIRGGDAPVVTPMRRPAR